MDEWGIGEDEVELEVSIGTIDDWINGRAGETPMGLTGLCNCFISFKFILYD